MLEAIILAGGFGTRIQSVVSDVPKPMAPVCGQPFLYHVLLNLVRQNINRIILAVGYKSEVIISHFGNKFQSAELIYSVEEEPLGTGGGIRKALELAEGSDILIVNGDTYFNVPIEDVVSFHRQNFFDLTMCLKPMVNFDRYGTVIVTKDRVTGMREKLYTERGLINGGIYVLNRNVLDKYPLNTKFSFETDVLEKEFSNLKFGAFISEGYFIDIGIPEDYLKAQEDFGKIDQ